MPRPLAPDLWELTAEQRVAPAVQLPVRATLARLSGGLWLHSPIPMSDEQAAQIDALGPVRWIVAPNAMHHLHAGAAQARWPRAEVVAGAAVQRKQPTLRIAGSVNAQWGDEVEAIPIEGAPGTAETVFFHHPSGSLICADLVFNIHEAPGLTPLVLTATGTWRRFAQSRVWRWQIRDRAAAAASAERLLALPITRVVPAHGDVVEDRARERLARALGWMRRG